MTLGFSYSRGRRVEENTPTRCHASSLRAFGKALLGDPGRPSRKQGAYICAPLSDGRRCAESVEPWPLLVFDFDKLTPEQVKALRADLFPRFKSFVHTTGSSTEERPRLRAFIECDRPVDRSESIRACREFARRELEHLGIEPDLSQARPEQPAFLPPKRATSWSFDGELLAVEPLLVEEISEGSRDVTLTKFAGSLRAKGASEATMLAALREHNKEHCCPPLPDADLRKIARSVARYSNGVAAPKPLEVRRASDLAAKQLPEIRVICADLIVPGLMLLSGPPKMGKSWLVLQMLMRLSRGDNIWSYETAGSAACLLLALEDTEGRLKRRIAKLRKHGLGEPGKLFYALEAPRMDEGLVDLLRAQIREQKLDLVVIDTLAMVRSLNPKLGRQIWQEDYQSVRALKKLADELGVAIIVVTHNSKAGSQGAGAQNAISGTGGLVAGVDGLMVLEHKGAGDEEGEPVVKLTIQHRDLEGGEFAIKFDSRTARWLMLGSYAEMKLGSTQSAVLDALKAAGPEGMSSSDLGTQLSKSRRAIAMCLMRLRRDGRVVFRPDGRNALRSLSVTPPPKEREEEGEVRERGETRRYGVTALRRKNATPGGNARNAATRRIRIDFSLCASADPGEGE